MKIFRRIVVLSLLTAVLAQLDPGPILSELPACSISCSEQVLPAAGCAFEDITNCLCRNATLQSQLSACIQTSCNRTEQFVAASVAQNIMCKGIPQPSRSAEIVRVVIILTAIAFPVIFLRLFSRYITACIWWDDWAIFAAGTLMVPMSVILIYSSTRGFGKHAWNISLQNITSLQKLYYVCQILYVAIHNLAKASILLLFLRIFPDQHFRLLTKIFLAWVVCSGFAFSMAILLQCVYFENLYGRNTVGYTECVPVNAVWNVSVKGKCINSSVVVFVGAALSILEDLVIILLPVPELKGLPLSLKKRLAVIFMFALGSFACVTSMVRLKYLVAFQIRSLDATWDSTDVVIWSFLEDYITVICASLIAIRPLLAKVLPSAFRNTMASQNHASHSTFRPHEKEFRSAGAVRSKSHGSAIELNGVGSEKAWMDGESVQEEGAWAKCPDSKERGDAECASEVRDRNLLDCFLDFCSM